MPHSFSYRIRPSAILDIAGPDRVAFLQGQLTQDVLLATQGRVVPTAGLTPKGKLLFAGRLFGMEDRLRLLLPAAVRESVRAHLSKYAVFQKVSIEDRSDELSRISLYGGATGGPPEHALVLPGEGEISAELLVPTPGLLAAVAALEASGAKPIPEEEAEALRIEAGRPEYAQDANSSHLADEAGFFDAVSTTKGCYVGQEIVARLRTYGRVNRRLVGFRFPDGIVPAGTVLRRADEGEGQGAAASSPAEPGRVTSSALSERLGAIGLGYAFRDIGIGDRLVAADGSAAGSAAIITALPIA